MTSEPVGSDCSSLQLWRVAVVLRQQLEVALAPLGLRIPHLQVLSAAMELGPLPQGRLAEVVGLDRQTMTNTLDDLAARGLAERLTAPQDRRRRLVAVTAEGQALQRTAVEVAQQTDVQVFEVLQPDERRELGRLLRSLSAARADEGLPAFVGGGGAPPPPR